MPFEKVEFEFPESEEGETTEIEIESSSARTVGSSDDVEPEEETKREVEAEVEVEVVDDTPKADQGRKASEPPENVTDEELEDYSDKVRKRIKHFSKGYHDERRAKEEALREREELERYTQQLLSENSNLKGAVNKNQSVLLDQAKRAMSSELESAKRKYKDAYEAGDSEAVIEAQEELTTAKIRADKLENIKVPSLQEKEASVEQSNTEQTAPVPVDPKANEWAEANPWFGSDDEMTSYVLGLHNKLVKTGVDPQSDEYYETINARMLKMFPEELGDTVETPKRQANVVTPATRSTSPKKIVLTRTQVSLAKRLGVSNEDYAKQVAIEMRKNANG